MSDQTDHDPRLLPALQSGGRVAAIIPQDFDSAYRIANAVCQADMAPSGLNTPAKATIAIMHGLEIGMTPMVALQSIAVINGRPSLWGDGALGLVQASGKLETIKETVDGKGDEFAAICRVIRRGDPEPKVGRFSVADAKRAKLWGKTGPWTQYPERMLKMRARAFALRDAFSDVLRGLGIAEEVQDIPDDRAAVEAPTPPTPPSPPTPPAPKKTKPKAAPPEAQMPPVEEQVDTETGEVTNPFDDKVVDVEEIKEPLDRLDVTQELDSLEADLAVCMDAVTVEEVFDHHDLLAKLEGTSNAVVDTAIALRLKNRALERIEKSK